MSEDELDNVASGRASNEIWICPECGRLITFTRHMFQRRIDEHIRYHEEINQWKKRGEETES